MKELGDSRLHVCEDVPFVIAGSANQRFRTGRYLTVGVSLTATSSYRSVKPLDLS